MTDSNSITKVNLWSAGGIVARPNNDGEYDVLLCKRLPRPPKQNALLIALPKGTPDNNESEQDTAIREVHEETGVKPRIITLIDTIQYSFIVQPRDDKHIHAKGNFEDDQWVECHKTVYFYLMAPVSGSPELHDVEFDEVFWINSKLATEQLTYQLERATLQKARELFATHLTV